MQKSEDEPHAKANDVRKPCPYLNAQHCGARTRGQKTCRGPAMKNGRCRMHGGKSTGPQTSAGLMRSKTTNLKHGFYSLEARCERQMAGQIQRIWCSMKKAT